jgi:hypothetical protein
MLRPITEEEKAKFTLQVQFQRGVEELLSEVYETGYSGYLDIWPVITTKNKQVILSISSNKVSFASSPDSNKDSIRYHIVQDKGCKRIK